jgi:hypothetical protein
VHLVHVVRRLDRLLPSLWQERVKARLTLPFEEWLEVVLQDESDRFEWRNLWQPHDVTGILERWGARLPAERITLVCSDDRDRALIPGTFEALLGLPEGLLRTTETARSNRSLTGNEAELLRRVNVVAAREKWTGKEYLTLSQLGIVAGFRKSPPAETDQPIPALPDWARARVAEMSHRQVDAIRASRARVVGDPEALLPDPDAAVAVPPPVTSVSLDTAVTAVLGAATGGRRLATSAARDARRASRRAAGTKAAATKQAGARPAGKRPVDQVGSTELLKIVAGRARRRLRRG